MPAAGEKKTQRREDEMRDETSLSFHRSDDGYKNLRSDRKSMQSVASTSHLPCAHMHHALPSSGKNGTHHVELAAGMPVDDVVDMHDENL